MKRGASEGRPVSMFSGKSDLVDLDDVAPAVDADHILLAVLPAGVLVARQAAVDGLHEVEAGIVDDVAALLAADVVLVLRLARVVDGIAGIIVAGEAAKADTDVDVDAGLGLRGGKRQGHRGGDGGGGDQGLANHLSSPWFLRFDDPSGHR
jgi:hypothetical protein